MTVAVIGASDKPHRYSYQAVALLLEHGHTVFPVHPRIDRVLGCRVYHSVADIPDPLDTVTLYVAEDRSSAMAAELLASRPRRIIFNPGAENDALARAARDAGIEAVHGCTLVMLRTNQF